MDYFNQHFTGERALFQTSFATIDHCLFDDGESPLKESHDFQVTETTFGWKYPLWYSHDFQVADSTFLEMGRAGIWYSYDFRFSKIHFIAPKGFRKCHDFVLDHVEFTDALETLWWCHDFVLTDIKAVNGPYFCAGSHDFKIERLDLVGNYAFDGVHDVEVSSSRLITKDAFWNSKNVVVRDSYIEGEYFGWNSENITLINCEIKSHQGFCYMKNITLIDCKVVDSDLCFEYCENIDATITTKVDSIKNPISGRIVVKEVGELIRDDKNLDTNATEIIIG